MIHLFLPLVPPVQPVVVEPPRIVQKAIPAPSVRSNMAAYSYRHYGNRTWKLVDPKVVVLHYTVSNTFESPWNLFASNSASPGPSGSAPEMPGGCTHFIVDKDDDLPARTVDDDVPTRDRHQRPLCGHRVRGDEFGHEHSEPGQTAPRRGQARAVASVRVGHQDPRCHRAFHGQRTPQQHRRERARLGATTTRTGTASRS